MVILYEDAKWTSSGHTNNMPAPTTILSLPKKIITFYLQKIFTSYLQKIFIPEIFIPKIFPFYLQKIFILKNIYILPLENIYILPLENMYPENISISPPK